MRLLLAVATFTLEAASAQSFKVCGHFCGPGWCDNGWHSEGPADQRECYENGETDGSCIDACSKTHDSCCGQERVDEGPCNTNLNGCLITCIPDDINPFATHCWNGPVPVPATGIFVVMGLNTLGCCGDINPLDCGLSAEKVQAYAIRTYTESRQIALAKNATSPLVRKAVDDYTARALREAGVDETSIAQVLLAA